MESSISIKILILLHLIVVGITFFSAPIHASEVDSYTKTRMIHGDAITEINYEINYLINIAVYTANRRGLSRPEDLYRVLNRTLGGRIVSRLEQVFEHYNDGRILKVDLSESIYSDMGLLRAPSLILSRKMGGVFKADKCIIGTDKLGHFIAQGYQYFKKCYLKEKGVEEALIYGINSELTYYGFLTTGIFSYGDLVANFQGMRFWNDILGEHPDILNEDQSPYIQKKKGKWVVMNPVDMSRYFDAGWDERINKNLFSDPEAKDSIDHRIQQVKTSENLPSPDIIKTFLDGLKYKYKAYSVYLLNIGTSPRSIVKRLKLKLKTGYKKLNRSRDFLLEQPVDPLLMAIDEYI